MVKLDGTGVSDNDPVASIKDFGKKPTALWTFNRSRQSNLWQTEMHCHHCHPPKTRITSCYTIQSRFYPHIETERFQYLYRHHGDLLVKGLSLGVGCCCSFSTHWLAYNFLGWLSILDCFPLCRNRK